MKKFFYSIWLFEYGLFYCISRYMQCIMQKIRNHSYFQYLVWVKLNAEYYIKESINILEECLKKIYSIISLYTSPKYPLTRRRIIKEIRKVQAQNATFEMDFENYEQQLHSFSKVLRRHLKDKKISNSDFRVGFRFENKIKLLMNQIHLKLSMIAQINFNENLWSLSRYHLIMELKKSTEKYSKLKAIANDYLKAINRYKAFLNQHFDINLEEEIRKSFEEDLKEARGALLEYVQTPVSASNLDIFKMGLEFFYEQPLKIQLKLIDHYDILISKYKKAYRFKQEQDCQNVIDCLTSDYEKMFLAYISLKQHTYSEFKQYITLLSAYDLELSGNIFLRSFFPDMAFLEEYEMKLKTTEPSNIECFIEGTFKNMAETLYEKMMLALSRYEKNSEECSVNLELPLLYEEYLSLPPSIIKLFPSHQIVSKISAIICKVEPDC